jgi:hypothetical protein
MMRVVIGVALLIFVVTGCQSSNIEEVVNEHNDIQNIQALNTFIEHVENKNEGEINYVQYGIEGQRGVRTLTFSGEQINVSHTVDGEFIEEYICQDIKVETEGEVNSYILKQCKGDFEGDFELVSVTNKDN